MRVIEIKKENDFIDNFDGTATFRLQYDETEQSRNFKVIFNEPATILFANGKKYISKAHDEPFDKEKGLLMCIAKANGISHLDLKKIIKNASK